jgi:hypothetical protein
VQGGIQGCSVASSASASEAGRDFWEEQMLLAENTGSERARLGTIRARFALAGHMTDHWKMDFSAGIGLNLARGAGKVGKADPSDLH